MNARGTFHVVLCACATAVGAGHAHAQTWTSKAPLPGARWNMGCTAIDGVIYLACGNTLSGPTNELLAYRPSSNTWSTLTSAPGPRYIPSGVAEIDGRLYLTGGWTTSPPLPNSNLWVYDPNAPVAGTGTWSTLSPHPTLTAQGGSGVIAGRLYVSTAADGFSGYRNFLYAYDPLSNSWSPKASTATAHGNAGFGVIHGRFYLVGGVNTAGQIAATVEEYNPPANQWTPRASMPGPRHNAASAVVNGKLYIAGGSDGATVLSSVVIYDPVTNTWTSGTPLPSPREGCAGASVNGVFYVIGGVGPGPAYLTEVLAYEPATCYANCDNSTAAPILNVADFTCFLQRYAAGCP